MGRIADGLAKRYSVWRQLAAYPERDAKLIVLACAEDGIDTNLHYVRCTRARWRGTIRVLQEAGVAVPA